MDSIKQVAVLMKKKNIDDGISIYFPDHIISGFVYQDEGEEDEECDTNVFSDDFGNEYLFMGDPNEVFSNYDVVWYCIPENELLEQYEGLNKEEATVQYFSDISEKTFVGFYHYLEQKTIFLSFNFSKMFTYINDNPVDDNLLSIENLVPNLFEIEMNYSDIDNKDLSLYGTISLDIESLRKLISLTDKELKVSMKNIYDKCKQITGYGEKTYYEVVLERINSTYETVLNIDDINKLKEICFGLENVYMDIAEHLDSMYLFSNDKVRDEVENFVYKAIDVYHSMGESDDVSEIKKTISSIRDRQKIYFKTMMEKEKTVQKEREERQQELEDAFSENVQTSSLNEKDNLLFNPRDMKEFLDKRVIGQEEAKKDVISAIFMNSLADESISKNTCLLVGPTGSGKTLIAESVAKFLDLPFVNIDTTQLTVPGYVGANIEDFLGRLIKSANGDVEKAERGIVILDEIDKKGSESNGDISGKGVLNTLLPFIQGTRYTVSYNRCKVCFDTSNLTIFMTGAFTDVGNGISEESLYNDSKIGFGTSQESQNKEDIAYKKLNIEDFVKYGNFPVELVGRISNIVQLSGHTKECLKSILTDSDISVLKLEAEKLKKINVEVKYSDDYLDAVAEKALKLKTGARSLKSTVENSIKEARWEAITSNDSFKAIVLNKDCVEDNLKAVLVYNDGNYITVEDLRNKDVEKAVEKVKK